MSAETLLRKVVVAFDGGDDEAFYDAIDEARAALGLVLAADADDVLERLKGQHKADAVDDERQQRRDRRMNRV